MYTASITYTKKTNYILFLHITCTCYYSSIMTSNFFIVRSKSVCILLIRKGNQVGIANITVSFVTSCTGYYLVT